jgi:hypothetical protein
MRVNMRGHGYGTRFVYGVMKGVYYKDTSQPLLDLIKTFVDDMHTSCFLEGFQASCNIILVGCCI